MFKAKRMGIKCHHKNEEVDIRRRIRGGLSLSETSWCIMYSVAHSLTSLVLLYGHQLTRFADAVSNGTVFYTICCATSNAIETSSSLPVSASP